MKDGLEAFFMGTKFGRKSLSSAIECYFNYNFCLTLLPKLHVGFEILAFPCNQFGGQEPGSNEDIKQFACTRFKAEFPIFDKVFQIGSCKHLFSFNQHKADVSVTHLHFLCILCLAG